MDKATARAAVWTKLAQVAIPDSRFHLNFNEYIPDFAGNDLATARLIELDAFQAAEVLFITPDNCLERLRAETVRAGKIQIMSTYGIRRGLIELRPDDVPPALADYAVTLDLIEKFGRPISLAELRQRYRLDMIVTGASAVNTAGVRFGKGHGFFDLEWAFLWQMGVVKPETPVIAVVHDYQVVEVELATSPYDTLCDLIITPTQAIRIESPQKPVHGILWDKLEPGMLAAIPPLQELKQLQETGQLAGLKG